MCGVWSDELHQSEQRNERTEKQLAATLEQNKALAVVEEKNQNLEAKVTRLQDENERLQHADAERELAQADARQWSLRRPLLHPRHRELNLIHDLCFDQGCGAWASGHCS